MRFSFTKMMQIASMHAYSAKTISSGELWHVRLEHPFELVVNKYLGKSILNISPFKNLKPCTICLRAKQTCETFPLSLNNVFGIFYLVHVDLWGPYNTASTCGAYYFLTGLGYYSRAVWLYLIAKKHEVAGVLKDFFAVVKTQFNKTIKVIRSDNGTKFVCLKPYFVINDILHQTTFVGTPEQNARIERKYYHILKCGYALCFQAYLPIKFWGERILAAGYLINKKPSSLLKGQTPFEMLYGMPPLYSHVRSFRCLAQVHVHNLPKDKF